MRYVIVGAGAIGGVLACRLAQHSITRAPLLIARGANAEAIRAHGARLRSPDGDVVIPVTTASVPQDVTLRHGDVLVFATKTHQALAALLEWVDQPVHDDAGKVVATAAEAIPVFMALNGVESERLALRLFQRVFGVCVWLPAVHLRPGEFVVRISPVSGVFIIGRYGAPATDADQELLNRLASDWEASSFRVHVVDDVMRWKYTKLIGNLGNAVQALVGPSVDAHDVSDALRAEGRAVLRDAEIATVSDEEQDIWRGDLFRVRAVPGIDGELGGSTWQSMMRVSGGIETDYLNGEIVLVARANGGSAPVNSAVQATARRAATERLPAGSMSIDELRQRVLQRD